jgi:hypothetical protein
MTKTKAFLIHFCLSFLVVSTCVSVVFVAWYPGFYFHVFGATAVLKVLVMVDLTLGPALTFLLYKPGKPGLVFDLCVVAFVQISALMYGMQVAYTERPYVTVFAIDRFEVLTQGDVDMQGVDPTLLQDHYWSGPAVFVARFPEDPKERQQLIQETLFEGKPDIQKRPELWVSYDAASDDVFSRARPVRELMGNDSVADVELEALISANDQNVELVYLPIVGKQHVFSLILDPATRLPVGLVDVDPWFDEPQSSEAANSPATG